MKIDKDHGPQTPEGLERCSRSSRKRGHYCAEAKAVRREARLHLKALWRLIADCRVGDRNSPADGQRLARPNPEARG